MSKLSCLLIWITYHCNYNCPYCVIKHNVKEMPETKPPEAWIKAINQFEQPLMIDFTGGEPLVYSGIDKLVSEIAPQHKLAITTNFSIAKSIEFFQRFSSITISFHPTMIKDEEEYFKRAKELRKGVGCSITTNFVAYRPQMGRIPELKMKFEDIGIHFHIDPQSPIVYREEEQNFLRPFMGRDRVMIGSTEEKKRFAENRLCSAGMSYAQVKPDGTMIPCFPLPPLGSFFDEPPPLRNDLVECSTKGCGGCDWDACWIYDLRGNLVKRGK